MSHDIYTILENLDAAQKSVKQLPALFRPADTSPQLSGPYPGRNATLGYLVGEGKDEVDNIKAKIRELETEQEENEYGSFAYDSVDAELQFLYSKLDKAKKNVVGEGEEPENAMRRAVTRRIVNQHPEWIVKYGVEFLMQVIDDVTEDADDLEEIGSSDVSAYVNMVHDQLRDRGGDRSEMADRKPFAETTFSSQFKTKDEAIQHARDKAKSLRDPEDGIEVWAMPDSGFNVVNTMNYQGRESVKSRGGKKVGTVGGRGQDVMESTATEDVLATMKRRLGDYLQDVATAIKKDPDLKDKVPQVIDQIKSVRTLKTDDGHEIKITGNEDDGFRISIKNKESNTKFANLDEATMAVEMFCARRRSAAESQDYIEEA